MFREAPIFLLEIYNTLSMPVMYAEKCVAIPGVAAEDMAWLGKHVFVACADGSLLLYSAFTTAHQVSINRVAVRTSNLHLSSEIPNLCLVSGVHCFPIRLSSSAGDQV